MVDLAQAAPAGLLPTVAGVALFATFGASASAALADPAWREPAAVALVVGASWVPVAGIGSAFWALVARGVLVMVARRPLRRS